ncbi:MAG: transposase [Clostridium sp.]|nr:transposase [Clostridium sp.]
MAKGKYQKWLTPDGKLLLEAWARDGLTDEQIAHNCGINTATLYDWKKKYPEISESLKRGKEVVDIEVENALLKRAKGYEYLEEKVEIEEDHRGKIKSRKVVQVMKQVAPDVGAAAFWLKNRRPDVWRDRPADSDDNAGQLENLLKGLKANE